MSTVLPEALQTREIPGRTEMSRIKGAGGPEETEALGVLFKNRSVTFPCKCGTPRGLQPVCSDGIKEKDVPSVQPWLRN